MPKMAGAARGVQVKVLAYLQLRTCWTGLVVSSVVGFSLLFAAQSDWKAFTVSVPNVLIFSRKTVSEADLEWVQQRQKLLSDTNRSTKVLLMTYMRGGSTFLGEIFDQNSDAIYWFEVAAQFYAGYFGFSYYAFPMDIRHYQNGTVRQVTTEEKRAVSDFLQAIYSCDFDNVPLLTVAHHFMRRAKSTSAVFNCVLKDASSVTACSRPLIRMCDNRHDECFQNLSQARQCITKNKLTRNCSVNELRSLEPIFKYYKCLEKFEARVKNCSSILKSTCQKAKIHSIKVHRFTMETLDLLIKEMPDIHIVHYTRDPRGILNSRSRTGKKTFHFLYSLSKGNLTKAAVYFCPKMMKDLEMVKKYKTKYPGAIMNLAYEELAANPAESLQKVYSFIGRQVPETVKTSLLRYTHADETGGSFKTTRKNATETSQKWREMLNATALEGIDNVCMGVYRELGIGN